LLGRQEGGESKRSKLAKEVGSPSTRSSLSVRQVFSRRDEHASLPRKGSQQVINKVHLFLLDTVLSLQPQLPPLLPPSSSSSSLLTIALLLSNTTTSSFNLTTTISITLSFTPSELSYPSSLPLGQAQAHHLLPLLSQESPLLPPSKRPLHEDIYTIPNLLTISRIAACPVLAYSIVQGDFTTATAILAYAGVTDWVSFQVGPG